ncbi:60S ribosomal protein L8 [Sarcoptes scabiei]|nr:60S ribosomal protein L8 [Sarcoptes scabiei]
MKSHHHSIIFFSLNCVRNKRFSECDDQCIRQHHQHHHLRQPNFNLIFPYNTLCSLEFLVISFVERKERIDGRCDSSLSLSLSPFTIVLSSIFCGKLSVYNHYLPEKKHRLNKNPAFYREERNRKR